MADHTTPRWTYTWEEGGGYDCMTDAFWIYCDGVQLLEIDLAKFGQSPGDKDPESPTNIEAKQKAEKLAAHIVSNLNKSSIL